MAGKGSPFRTRAPTYREPMATLRKEFTKLQAHVRSSPKFHKLPRAEQEGWEACETVFGDWVRDRLLKLYKQAEEDA